MVLCHLIGGVVILIQTGKTFLTVERQNGAAWDVVLTDGHWDTRCGVKKSCHVLPMLWCLAVGSISREGVCNFYNYNDHSINSEIQTRWICAIFSMPCLENCDVANAIYEVISCNKVDCRHMATCATATCE